MNQSTDPLPDSAPPPIEEFGPVASGTAALFLLADVMVSGALSSHSKWEGIAFLGFTLGQVGAASVWAMVPGKVHQWKKVLSALAVAVVIGGLMSTTKKPSFDSTALAISLIIFLAHAALTMLLIGGWRLTKSLHHHSDSKKSTAVPRFGVKHLLIAMVFVAISSTLIRVALPKFGMVDDTLLKLVVPSAVLAAFASEFLFTWRSKFWGFSALLLSAIVLTSFEGWLTGGYEEFLYVNAVQVAILALAVGLPQLDSRTTS